VGLFTPAAGKEDHRFCIGQIHPALVGVRGRLRRAATPQKCNMYLPRKEDHLFALFFRAEREKRERKRENTTLLKAENPPAEQATA
jgi:hypothetical protein